MKPPPAWLSNLAIFVAVAAVSLLTIHLLFGCGDSSSFSTTNERTKPEARTYDGASPVEPDAGAAPALDAGSDAPLERDADADAPDARACPPPSDPCDCRSEIAACAGYTCGVAPSCAAPFWLDRTQCNVEHRISGVDGCDALDGAICCNGTQAPLRRKIHV